MELDQLRLVILKKYVQLIDCVFHLLLDGFVILEIFETDREFHMRTYRLSERRRVGRGLNRNAASG